MQCRNLTALPACLLTGGVPTRSIVVHYEYGTAASGATTLVATRYTEADGVTVLTLAPGESVSPGACGAPLPFQWGCVRDETPGAPTTTCRQATTREAFADASYTNLYVGSPASGQHTFQMTFASASEAARMLGVLVHMMQAGARTHETIGPFTTPYAEVNFHPGMVVAASAASAFVVDLTLDVSPAQDTPPDTIQAPCVFSEPDYATANAALRAAYSTLSPGQPAGNPELTFVTYDFVSVQAPGPAVVTTTPVKVMQLGNVIELRDMSDAVYTMPTTATLLPGPCPAADVETMEACYRLKLDTPYGRAGDVLAQRTFVTFDPSTGLPMLPTTHVAWWNLSQDQFLSLMDTSGNAIIGTVLSVDTSVMVSCEQYGDAGSAATPVTVQSGGLTIAGAVLASTAAFAGAPSVFNTGTVPGALLSVTVSVHDAENGLVGQTPSQLVVATPDSSSIAMMAGETKTWSVARGQDAALARDFNITANGTAYATITYTYEG